jgi:hypothetical protein
MRIRTTQILRTPTLFPCNNLQPRCLRPPGMQEKTKTNSRKQASPWREGRRPITAKKSRFVAGVQDFTNAFFGKESNVTLPRKK